MSKKQDSVLEHCEEFNILFKNVPQDLSPTEDELYHWACSNFDLMEIDNIDDAVKKRSCYLTHHQNTDQPSVVSLILRTEMTKKEAETLIILVVEHVVSINEEEVYHVSKHSFDFPHTETNKSIFLEMNGAGIPCNIYPDMEFYPHKPTATPTRAGGSGTDEMQHQYHQPHDVTSRQMTTPTSPVDRVGGSSMSTDQLLTRSHLVSPKYSLLLIQCHLTKLNQNDSYFIYKEWIDKRTNQRRDLECLAPREG
ncbi:hypothetical protein AKO1_002239 [Acrasis kona]|uniref:Uncharacterized protein n=1 Tax=Acrasis kona TaxID=1008807 RepID=A0AAW2ZBL9_9EUKA